MIHIRQNSDPTCPWRGRSGLEVAQSSGGLASTLVHALTAEGEIPITRIVPQPQGDSQNTANSIRAGHHRTGLRLALPETTASGGSRRGPVECAPDRLETVSAWPGLHGGLASTYTRWRYKRPPPCVACRRRWCQEQTPPGQPFGRVSVNSSQLTVQPLGRILEAEVSRVLERDGASPLHHQLASADVAARARALKALIENDIDADRALALVGWA